MSVALWALLNTTNSIIILLIVRLAIGFSMSTSKRLQVVVPEWLEEAVRKLAERKGVNASEYVRDLLKKEAAKHGLG
jgi:predicted DNA binding CopG/RHH family protein